MRLASQRASCPGNSAFTLIELLVSIGIISLLMSVLLPALGVARAQARVVKCAAQVQQISTALLNYATDNRGKFPLNINAPSPGQYWCDDERIGTYLPNMAHLPVGIGGGVLACPDDPDSARSYAMNIWASSDVDQAVKSSELGTLWSASVSNSSQMILVAERWASSGSPSTGYYAPATLGLAGSAPAKRFGAAGGISPLITAGRYGLVSCELPYARHRKSNSSGSGTQPIGRVNIGYADGHVALKSEFELVTASGRTTGDSLWSPLDPDLNQ